MIIKDLTPPQQEITAAGLLNRGFNCILQMPTGSGKTWLAEQTIRQVIAQGKRAIYLTPLRALAEQLYGRWQENLAPSMVGIFTGDYGLVTGSYPVSYQDSAVLIMTPEKLDACTRHWRSHWHWLPEVSLVVVDEIHLLGEPQRGSRLEGTLSRLNRLNPFAVIVGLSATLGNIQELSDWLGGVYYVSNWRPIPLDWRTVRYKRATDKPHLLVQEILRTIENSGKSLVFVESRRRAERVCHDLKQANIKATYHHAGLNRSSRQRVEADFSKGLLDVVVATSTLEMGLNFPVRQVILYDVQTFDGEEFIPLSTNSVWQRAGRAGRPGLDSSGEVVLFVPTWQRDIPRYEQGSFEPIKSHLHQSNLLAEQLVAEISSGLATRMSQLTRICNRSLASVQGTLPNITSTIVDMCEAGILVQDTNDPDSKFKATRLGHIATRYLLSPSTVLLLQQATQQFHDWTFLDLLIIVCSCPDIEPILPVNFEELDSLALALSQEPSSFLNQTAKELCSLLRVHGRRLLSSFKMAFLLRQWTRCSDLEHLALEHHVYPYELQRLRENTIRLIGAWKDLLKSKTADNELDPSNPNKPDCDHIGLNEKVSALLTMISGGIDEYCVTLTLVPGIGPTLARRLYANNISDIEELSLAEPEYIAQIKGISLKRAKQWINASEEMGPLLSAYRFRETGQNRITATAWPDNIDPYRFRRSLELAVRPVNAETYSVSGGLEPHLVTLQEKQLYCDCLDFENGNQCKHCLAVRLANGDSSLKRLKTHFTHVQNANFIDLNQLWLDHSHINRGRYKYR